MPLYEVTQSGITPHQAGNFAELQLRERQDLQRLIRDDISVLGDDLLVVAEEFGEWEDARRRIDLLALDKSAHLVVIELKRTEEGGHMDLQALRYAAMVSSMVFDDVVRTYEGFLGRIGADGEAARSRLTEFLELEEGDEVPVSRNVRIVLVSRDFGREITTAVLWLNRYDGMDIRCIRLVPYQVGGKVLLDVQQVVPLPEAADYQVRLRRQEQEQERSRVDGRDFTRYSIVVDGQALPDQNKRNSVRQMVEQLVNRGADPERIEQLLGARKFRGVHGELATGDGLRLQFESAYPDLSFDPNGFFLDHAIRQGARTWVLSKRWGRDTERVLMELEEEFPDVGVSFRRA